MCSGLAALVPVVSASTTMVWTFGLLHTVLTAALRLVGNPFRKIGLILDLAEVSTLAMLAMGVVTLRVGQTGAGDNTPVPGQSTGLCER